MRCNTCQQKIEEILPNFRMGEWLKLMYYFDHELAEEEITVKTWEEMTNALSALRPEEVPQP